MRYALYIFLLVFAFSSTCALTAEASDVSPGIAIKDYKFVPATLNIVAGAKVTWTNQDEVPHTIVDSNSNKVFRSGALDTNDSYSFVFVKPGTYHYFCTLHPTMVGTIIVAAK